MTDTLTSRDAVELNAKQVLGAEAVLMDDAAGMFDLTETPELRRRRLREGRFKVYGLVAIAISLAALALLVGSTFAKGVGVLSESQIGLEVTYPESLDPSGDRNPEDLRLANYRPVISDALARDLGESDDLANRRKLVTLLSAGAGFDLGDRVAANPELVGTTETVWLSASSDVDALLRGRVDRSVPEALRRISDADIARVERLEARGQTRRAFNMPFFSNGDSREPEIAGVLGAFLGSLLTVAVCLALSFPIGVATAVYLEEFAPKNRFTDFIEVNINNLAAVPSIVYGLLGLYMFLGVFGLPRSTPLVGGMVLALMALPIIIIASRASLRSVPPSVRAAALGLGASKVQTTFHHVVPLAMPGMLTGTIIAMARALGETAPLLMIGMVAFIVDLPGGVTDAATTMPVQIFLWFDNPERAFQERASAAIIVLLLLLVLMNLVAVLLRRKLERRW